MLITVFVDYSTGKYLTPKEHADYIQRETLSVRQSDIAFQNWVDLNYKASEVLGMDIDELDGLFESECYDNFVDDEDPYEKVTVEV